MNRFLMGIGMGAALAYFYDQQRGEARRARLGEWVNQYFNSDTMEQARQATQATIGQARNLTGQVSDQVNQIRAGRRPATTTTTTTTTGTSNSAKSSAGAQI